jgi:peptide/nickel transport system permease protein
VCDAVCGIALGSAIAMAKGRIRGIGARLIDLLLAYPPIIVAVVVAAILGPGTHTSVVAIGVAFLPSFARLAMKLTASVSSRDFVSIARGLGVSPSRIVLRHVLPNMAEPLVVLTSVALSSSVIALSALSFLGIGVQPPSFDWGQMLSEGLSSLYTNPVAVVGPLLGILATGVAAGLLGEGRASTLDVRTTRTPTVDVPLTDSDPTPQGETPEDEATLADACLQVRGLRVGPVGDPNAIVRGVDITVRRGEVVGVCGESGSGKTLTAQAIAQLLPPSIKSEATALKMAEADLTVDAPGAVLAAKLGFVFQDPGASLNPAQRIGSQVVEAYRHHTGTGREAARRLAVERLAEVGVGDAERVIQLFPHQLSGGQRQRVVIAMALMLDPELLVADEPTTALDVSVQASVLALLARLSRDRGLGILLISHDIGVVREICDRVVVMYAGRIVEEITVDDLEDGRAAHPYTRALLEASPRIGTPLAADTGADWRHLPVAADGCAYRPRCPAADRECAAEVPVLVQAGTARRVACHHPNPDGIVSGGSDVAART